MGNIITPVLPHDLPENWNDTQYVSPGGTEVGLTEKHGYNYLMKQVNNSQKAINELDAELKDIDTTLANKAPAGFGLGEYTPTLISDCNTIRNGWYRVDASTANIPDVGLTSGVLRIDEANSDLIFQSLYFYSNSRAYEMKRKHFNGVWGPWEWVNPPFIKDVVYRTTERHLDNPVYKKMDSNGVIWWSTDQSTWKREAERAGAAPDGYGLGKESKEISSWNDATKNGWYKCSIVGESANSPDNNLQWFGRVDNWTEGVFTQTVFSIDWHNGGILLCARRYYHISHGWQPWEYVNPPMVIGVEYRTTERYLGKPVYVKATNCGALPGNGSTKNVVDTISNIEHLVSYGGDIYNAAGTDSLPYYGGENRRVEVDAYWGGIGLWNVGLGETDTNAIVWRKYTKTTD